MRFKKAFTMAEAILVMTILGIIATIMISTLKPAQFKERGLKVMARKVLSEIDTATTQILINNTRAGKMDEIYVAGSSSSTFSAATAGSGASLAALYKGYLTATRQAIVTSCKGYDTSFYLKDGACVGISTGPQADLATRFPGETGDTTVSSTHGVIFFDTNGDEEPNIKGKDQFVLPVGIDGIMYSN